MQFSALAILSALLPAIFAAPQAGSTGVKCPKKGQIQCDTRDTWSLCADTLVWVRMGSTADGMVCMNGQMFSESEVKKQVATEASAATEAIAATLRAISSNKFDTTKPSTLLDGGANGLKVIIDPTRGGSTTPPSNSTAKAASRISLHKRGEWGCVGIIFMGEGPTWHCGYR